MRSAIWSGQDNLDLDDNYEIEVGKEDAKNIWEQLKTYMPLYTLFQSDRKNSDSDSEVQVQYVSQSERFLAIQKLRIA